MSLVERTLDLARNPKISFKEAEIQQASHNKQVRQFFMGDISLSELNEATKDILNEENSIVLDFPGPLYGLLRRIGFDKNEAKKISFDEKAHYYVAKEEGIKVSKFAIQFSSNDNYNKLSNDTLKTFQYRIYFWFKLPKNMDNDKAREAFRKILLAHEEPSPDDLAKIP